MIAEKERAKVENVSHFDDKQQYNYTYPGVTIKLNKTYLIIKRALDFLVALIATAILLLPSLIIALSICLESKGSPICAQQRMGKHGKIFTFYKFRSMKTDAPVCATRELENGDEYITKTGGYLRRTSLDELPQLINILKGDMSFIGPRPVLLVEEELITKRLARGVYDVTPGISGYAQVNGRDFVGIDSKVEYDSFYATNASLLFDIKIFFITISKVIMRDGIADGKIEQNTLNEIEENEKVAK